MAEGTEVWPEAWLSDGEGLGQSGVLFFLHIGWMQQEWNSQFPSHAMLPEDARRVSNQWSRNSGQGLESGKKHTLAREAMALGFPPRPKSSDSPQHISDMLLKLLLLLRGGEKKERLVKGTNFHL